MTANRLLIAARIWQYVASEPKWLRKHLVCAEVPAVVVGVVGMGHVPGIEKNWDKQLNVSEIMR